jgi:glycosyltransferase involved in cell wall biosynthesis
MLTYFLAKRGYEILVITSTYLDGKLLKKTYFQKWDKTIFPARVVRHNTLKIERVHSPPLILFFPFMILFQKFDMLHVHGVGSFSTFLGMFMRLLFPNLRLILTADINKSTFLRIRKSPIYSRIMSLPLKVADAVVVFTDTEKGFLQEIGVNNTKIHVIPMSIRFEELSKIGKSLGSDKIVLGFLGKIQTIKGVHRLVKPMFRIVKEYPNQVKVIFAGPSQDDDYASSIINKLSKLPDFEYWGPLPMEKVDNFFRTCNIVFVPSLSESCGAVSLEAMAAGKCVIASNISPIDKFIEHGKSGFLVDDDEQFYEYARLLINNPKLLFKIGRNARKKVSHHSWGNIICKFESLYEYILETLK